MNAIMPAEATHIAARTEANMRTTGIHISVRRPKVWASTLPSSRIFSRFPRNGDVARNSKATTPHRDVDISVELLKPPIDQDIMLVNCSLVERLSKRVVKALATKLNIMPDSKVLFVENLELRVRPIRIGLTMSIAAIAPKIAKKVIELAPIIEVRPRAMHNATPKSAPPERPRVYGSTNGLRNTDCIMIPEAPSKAPMARAIIVRGRRNLVKITYSTLSEGMSEIENNLANGSPFSPMHSETAVAKRHKTIGMDMEKNLRIPF